MALGDPRQQEGGWDTRARQEISKIAVRSTVSISARSIQRSISLYLPLAVVSYALAAGPNFSLQDTSGKTYSESVLSQHKATVFLFVATDCPNSNTYAPVLARLYREYSPRGVAFFNVYSDPSETADTIRKHDADFQVPFPALLDPRQVLARQTGARSTPEAVVLGPDGQELYRGRVDNRFVDFGKTRFSPTEDNLREALDTLLQNKPIAHPVTKVLGCAIPGVN
jgi:thiol-disulfide isomerase/thioredoxin